MQPGLQKTKTVEELRALGFNPNFRHHAVRYHGDGGQMCIPGEVKLFDDVQAAAAFAEAMINEPGHLCPNSVHVASYAQRKDAR